MFSRSNENSSNNLCFNICYAQMELRSICILLTCECFKNSRFGEVRGLGGGGGGEAVVYGGYKTYLSVQGIQEEASWIQTLSTC